MWLRSVGTRFANGRDMPKRPETSLLAFATSGDLLVNIASSLPRSAVRGLMAAVGLPEGPFIGIPLTNPEKRSVARAVDDAAAGAISKVMAQRAKPRVRRG